MVDNQGYALWGGKAVKITPLEVKASGEIFAEEGCAFNPVICDMQVAPYLKELTNPPEAEDGTYIFTAIDDEDASVVGICVIDKGAVSESYGDGTFALDESGDAPAIEWTPSVTAETVTVWFAGSVES